MIVIERLNYTLTPSGNYILSTISTSRKTGERYFLTDAIFVNGGKSNSFLRIKHYREIGAYDNP